MAGKYFPFRSAAGDRKYSAEDWAAYFALFIGNGVFYSSADKLKVAEYDGMKVKVQKGAGFIAGRMYLLEEDTTITLDTADGVLNRIDRIVLRCDYVNRLMTVTAKKGSYSANPTAPDLTRDADVYELALADVYVAAGAVTITAANITDQRFNTSLCGIVTGLIEQADTEEIFSQFQAAFEEWFEYVKAVLDEDATGNLLAQINTKANNSDLQAEVVARKAEVAVERARIDALTKLEEGSTTGDAELQDVRIGADGVTYETAGAAVRTQFTEMAESCVRGIGTLVSNTEILDDCDNALPNKIYTITTSEVLNLPEKRLGTLLTFNYAKNNSGGYVQIYIAQGNIVYTRIRWGSDIGTWGDWKRVDNEVWNNLTGFNSVVTAASLSDFDEATPNKIYCYNDTTGANMPINKKGVLITFAYNPAASNLTGGQAQMYFTEEGEMYYRTTYFESVVSWLGWVKVNEKQKPYILNNAIAENLTESPLEYITEEPGLLRCFRTVGCIGDSLASGECAYLDEDGNNHYVDMYDISWGQCLARMTGNTYYNFSKGGLSTKTWLSSDYATQCFDGAHLCTAYFIGLGQNDKNQSIPIGTSADIDINDYSQNAETYYGYYATIIQKIKEVQPKAKIFIMTDPLSTTETAGYNAVVREMAALFENVYLMDLYTYGNSIIKGANSFLAAQFRNAHYNAVGYQTIAYIISTYVNWIMKNNPTEFREIEFIGTDYSYYS